MVLGLTDEKHTTPLPEDGRAKKRAMKQRHDAKTKPKEYSKFFYRPRNPIPNCTELGSEQQLYTLMEPVVSQVIHSHGTDQPFS